MSNKELRITWILWTIGVTLVAVLYSGVTGATPVSFHGGYFRKDLSPNQGGSLSIRLAFRTFQQSGVLFLVNGDSSYLSLVAVDDRWLVITQQLQTSQHVSGGSIYNASIGSMHEWRTVHFLLNDTYLQLAVDGNLFFNYMIPHSVTPLSVVFGGSDSFFNSSYRHLPTPHFFIGCMRNVSVGHKDILLDSKLYGISDGCCIMPRYPALCVNQTFPNLSLTLPPSASGVLSISFRLQLAQGGEGVVMSSESPTTAWLLQLTSGSLQLIANASGTHLQLTCLGDVLAVGPWHQVDLVFGHSSVSCAVNNLQPVEAILDNTQWSRSTIHVGGAELSPQLTNQVSDVWNGFMGCIQRLRVDSADVDPSVFVNSSQMKATVKSDLVVWPQHSSVSELVVTERMQERLSKEVLKIQVPEDNFRDAVSLLYQQELERAVHFSLAEGPSYGRIFLGVPSTSVNQFTLHNILSSVESEQVGYYHTRGGNLTDEVVFNVWVGCSNQRLADLPTLTLLIMVEERDVPQVMGSQFLQLVVGTRVALTDNVLLVEDSVTSDPSKILFTVKNVSIQGSSCSSCELQHCLDCGDAGYLVKDDMKVMFFTQADVNSGLVAFQHYASFSTAILAVHLIVTVQDREGDMDVVVEVDPIPGQLMLVSDILQCMFVKEAGMALVQPKHLAVETTFDAQSPVITYDLLSVPEYGVLQLWRPQTQEWIELSLNHTLVDSSHSFTQADIKEGHVRYVQTPMNSGNFPGFDMGLDNFTFQVRSYNLSGPEGFLCVHIIPESIQLQPSIAIQLHPLVLSRENSSAPITTTNIKTSLENMDYHYLSEDPDYEIDVDQLGIVYHLVDAPSYGALELDSTVLTAGDNFTLNDIRSQRLIYRHFGTENHQDSFTFYGEAGSTAYLPIKAPNLTANLSVVINITATNNHLPVLTILEPIRPLEGMTVLVTPQNLNVTDADKPSEPIHIILRNLKRYPSIGIFALSSAPNLPLMNFTMEQIVNRSIVFVHKLDSSARLVTQQGIKVKHDKDYIKGVIGIEAVPLELDVTLTVPANTTCIDTEGTLHLHKNMFDVGLSDANGNDDQLVGGVTVAIASSGGQLFLRRSEPAHSATEVPVSEFLLQDINYVSYVLGNESRLQTHTTLLLEFSYFHSTSVLISLNLCVHPVLVPMSVLVYPLELREGHLEHLTPQHILVTSSRPGHDGTLQVELLQQPMHGSLVILNRPDWHRPLRNFTVDELRNEQIAYEYNGVVVSTVVDYFSFRVCSESGCLSESILNITVYPVNITANDSEVMMQEGSKYVFNVSDFKISAPSRFTRIKLIIPSSSRTRQPDIGDLKISTSAGDVVASFLDLDDVRRGRLFYKNRVKEHENVSYEFLVEAESSSLEEEPQSVKFMMTIVFTPVNDNAPELERPVPPIVQVVWGGSVLITSAILNAHDYDSHNRDEDLIWFLDNVPFYRNWSNGYFYLVEDPGPEGGFLSNWTEGAIRKNQLHYRHTGNKRLADQMSDNFLLYVTDGERSTQAVLTFDIKAVIIEQNGSLEFTVNEGGAKTITHDYMHFSAQNVITDDADFVITLIDPPSHGQLLLKGTVLQANSQFYQNQTAEGQLEYVHDHSDTLKDSFNVSTSVPSRGNEQKTFSFKIKVHRLDDNAPEVILHGRLYVMALQRVPITNQTMSIVDGDSLTIQDYDKIVCQIMIPPTKGWLEKNKNSLLSRYIRNFTKYDLDNGSLFYRHLDDSLHPDFFIFNVSDGFNHQPQVYNLSIIVLPEVVSVTLKTLTLSENERVPITVEELQVSSIYLRHFEGIIMVLGAGPRHGHLLNSNTQETVRTFSTEAIAAGHIYYNHSGDESSSDSFMMKYVVLDPAGNNRTSNNLTFHISISPVDDQPPVVNDPHTSLRLWAMDTVLLTEAQFNVTDVDTAPSKLNFTVRISRQDSYVAFTNNTSQFIHWFTQADLRAGRVVLVHRNGPFGIINYTVWDSLFNASGSVKVLADTLTLDCQYTNWDSIKVKYLSSVPVSTVNMYCTTADDSVHREIQYSFPSRQSLGHFEVDSQPVSSFNSTTLQAGMVRYVHTETVNWTKREVMGLNVSSPPAVPAYSLPVVIDVEYPEPLPGRILAVNQGLMLSEGGTMCFNSSILDGGNVRYDLWQQLNSSTWQLDQLRLVYTPEEGPRHGKLTLRGLPLVNFTQRDLQDAHTVCYTHDDSEEHQDKIRLKIQMIAPNGDALGGNRFEEVHLFASPVNDLHPVLNSTLEKTLVQNFDSTLNGTDLSLLDGDTPPNLLFVHLASTPNNVDIVMNGSLLSTGSRFSQNDINLGHILLLPHQKGGTEFQFTYTDGNFTSNSMTFTLLTEGHELRLVSSEDITYAQDERRGALITRHNLDTYTNGLASQTIFSVQQGPTYGRLVVGGTEVKNFSQEDINRDRVSYAPYPGTQNSSDSFVFNVSNINITLVNITMKVRVLVWGRVNTQVITFDPQATPSLQGHLPAVPLSARVLVLDELEKDVKNPPTIKIVEGPMYGHLERQVDLGGANRHRRSSHVLTELRYEELQAHWIMYVWDYEEQLINSTVEDVIKVLVLAPPYQPGEAIISLNITPPLGYTPKSTTFFSLPTVLSTAFPPATNPVLEQPIGDGFPLFTLVPIIGIICFLVLLVVVMICFCLFQQKHRNFKFSTPGSLHSPHQSLPWSASPTLPPGQLMTYDLDPSGGHLQGEDQQHNSETSSGFSEPDVSFHGSPVQSYPMYQSPSPSTYRQAPIPSRSRMRSNVSITFSSPRSTTSELSYDEVGRSRNLYTSSVPHYPVSAASTDYSVPVRPSSHAVSRQPSSNQRDEARVQPSSLKQAQKQDHHHSTHSSHGTELLQTEMNSELDCNSFTGLPDIRDHNLNSLFHAPNPVLKKEEYWI